jgi:hypothetical protein
MCISPFSGILTEAFLDGCSVVALSCNSAFVGVSATDGIRFPFPLWSWELAF